MPSKSEAQQAPLMGHRVRDQLIGQHSATIDALRGHLAEWGHRGGATPGRPAPAARDPRPPEAGRITPLARDVLHMLATDLRALEGRIAERDRRLVARAPSGPSRCRGSER